MFGNTIADGQDDCAGKIIKNSQVSYNKPMDIIMPIATFKMLLKGLGCKDIEMGAGMADVEEVLMK